MTPTARTRTLAICTSASSKRREYSRSWMSWNSAFMASIQALSIVPGADVDAQLVALALVARLGDVLEPDLVAVDAVALELRERLGLELRELLLERGTGGAVGIQRRGHRVRRRDVLVDHVGREQAERRGDARVARHQHVLDADLGCDLGREERPAAALGDEHELARVEALAHRGLLDRVDHRVHEDAVDAHRRVLDRAAELAREVRLDGLPGEILPQAHLAAQEELGAQPAEHDHRVGGGRLGAAAVVRDRARDRRPPSAARRGRSRPRRRRRSSRRRRRSCRRRPSGSSPGTARPSCRAGASCAACRPARGRCRPTSRPRRA